MSGRLGRVSAYQTQKAVYEENRARRMAAFGQGTFNYLKTRVMNILGVFFRGDVIKYLVEQTAAQSGFSSQLDWCSKRSIDMRLLWIFERYQIIGRLFEENANLFRQNQIALQFNACYSSMQEIVNERAPQFDTSYSSMQEIVDERAPQFDSFCENVYEGDCQTPDNGTNASGSIDESPQNVFSQLDPDFYDEIEAIYY